MRNWLNRRRLAILLVLTFIALGVVLMFTYFTYAFQSLLSKSLAAAAGILFSFLFIVLFYAALNKTSFAKKKTSGLGIFVAFLLIIAVYVVARYLIGKNDVLLLLPLSWLLLYWTYIDENFIKSQPNDDEQAKLALDSLRSYLNQRTNLMVVLVFVLAVLSLFFITGLLPVPSTFGTLYNVSLTVYAVIFSVVTAFGVLGFGRNEAHPLNTPLRRPLLGLANMCVVFFLISLVGTVLGVDVDTSLFTTGTTLSEAFSWETLGIGVIRILLIESILISFPFTLVYLYAILKTFLSGPTTSTVDSPQEHS